MGLRKFFATAANLFRHEPRAKSPDGLDEIYRDAAILIARLYHGPPRRISRLVMQKRGMSNGRWAKARGLLLATHVITPTGQIREEVAPNSEIADTLISQWIDENRRRRKASRNYVIPDLS